MPPNRRLAVVVAGLVIAAAAVNLAAREEASTPLAASAPALPPGRAFTLTWGGDTTLGSSAGLPANNGWALLRPVARVLRRADIAAVNLEGTFGASGASKCGPASEACFAFQAPPRNARSLRRAGVDIVNLANNHAWDYGAAGMRATTNALRRADVAFTGRPGEIRYLRLPRARVAFVGFAAYPWASSITSLPAVQSLVASAARRSNVVVAFFHAGAEGRAASHTPVGTELAYGEDRGDVRSFAHAAIDAGADLILGSGPHVLRGIEVYRGRLIAYSLGNLAGYKNFATGGLLSQSALLSVRVGRDGRLISGRLHPLVLDRDGVPARDRSAGAVETVKALSREDFGEAGARVTGRGQFRLR